MSSASPALPPGPSLPPWLQLMQFLYRPQQFLGGARERYGTPFTFRLPGLPPFVSFCDPTAVKEVFTGSPQELYAGQANIVLKPFLGPNSVLVLDGERHMQQRRLLLPPFRGDRMKSYGGAMIDITRAQMATWGRLPMRMQTQTQAITLEVILRTVFGMQEGRERRTEALRTCLLKMLSMLDNPLSIVKEFQRDLGPWSPWRRFLNLRTRMRGLIMDEIADRREAGRGDRDDVLSLLLEATHEDGSPMADEEIRDELVTMLVAGHETTATGLSWAFHRLSKHPDVLRRVQDEIDRVYPDGRVTPEKLAKLEYLDAVTKETLRVHPVIPGGEGASGAHADRWRRPAQRNDRGLQHRAGEHEPRRLGGSPALRSRALPGKADQPLRVLPVRRRRAAMHRRSVRLVGDACRAGDRVAQTGAGRGCAGANGAAEHHAQPIAGAADSVPPPLATGPPPAVAPRWSPCTRRSLLH